MLPAGLCSLPLFRAGASSGEEGGNAVGHCGAGWVMGPVSREGWRGREGRQQQAGCKAWALLSADKITCKSCESNSFGLSYAAAC